MAYGYGRIVGLIHLIQTNPSDKPGQAPGFSSQEPKERPDEQARYERLNTLGLSLARTRKEAMEARQQSGIEDQWREDEEHYESIDEQTRSVQSAWNSKLPGQQIPKVPGSVSTLFTNITRPYVDAAAAKIGDILLPTDERAWSLSETPIPEFIEKAKGVLPKEAIAGMATMGIAPEVQDQVAEEEAKDKKRLLDEAHEKAKKAEKRIEDWHIEGQYHAECRKVLKDCVRIGSGVLKGPIPTVKRQQMYKEGALMVVEEVKPISKRVDPRNFFPDGACGENIHHGNFVWERDYITAKQLRALKEEEGYIGAQIDACLEEGPNKRQDSRQTADGRIIDDKALYEIWYYTGQVAKEDLEAAGCTCPEGTSISAVVTMVNDRVIKAARNHLDTGEFPYDLVPWKRKLNMPWGDGVAREIRTPQLIVLAGVRVMLTNAGRAAGPIFVRASGLRGLDNSDDITPWKQFEIIDSDIQDARAAFAMFEIPDRYNSLMGIVQFGIKLAEDVTGLPLLLQGQTGSAPETLGGQQLVQNNASGTLREFARTVDDCITEPHIRRYYSWLLQYGEDDEKGEFVIDARGSTYLVEQDIYKQELAQYLQAALNPAFGMSPEKVMRANLRANKRNPDEFMLTDEEKAKAQQQQPEAPDPAIEVAKMRAESEKAALEAKAQEADRERAHEREMKNLDVQISMMKLSESRGIALDKIKADLAGTSMKLKTQKELAASSGRGPQVMKPPVEPPKRAPNGQAFQK